MHLRHFLVPAGMPFWGLLLALSTASPAPALAAAPATPVLQAQGRFVQAARHAMDAIDFQDSTDPSVLLALLDQLQKDPALAPLQEAWRPLLEQRQHRLTDLERTAAVRRRFAAALHVEGAAPAGGAPLPVDSAACEDAIARLDAAASDTPMLRELPVHLGTTGARRLGELQTLCEQGMAQAQQQRPLSGPVARPAVVRLVGRLFAGLQMGGKLSRVQQLGNWQHDHEHHRVSLRLLLGLQPAGAISQCQTLELTLDVPLARRGRTATAPALTDLAEPQPISCERLR